MLKALSTLHCLKVLQKSNTWQVVRCIITQNYLLHALHIIMSTKLLKSEIQQSLKQLIALSINKENVHLPEFRWKVVNDQKNSEVLTRRFQFKSFEDTWAFLTKVSLRSHKLQHHPKLTTLYNVVDLELTTHDVQGLTETDFKMAKVFSKFAAKLGEKYE